MHISSPYLSITLLNCDLCFIISWYNLIFFGTITNLNIFNFITSSISLTLSSNVIVKLYPLFLNSCICSLFFIKSSYCILIYILSCKASLSNIDSNVNFDNITSLSDRIEVYKDMTDSNYSLKNNTNFTYKTNTDWGNLNVSDTKEHKS